MAQAAMLLSKDKIKMGLHIGFLTSEYPHAKVTHAAGIGTSIGNLAMALRLKDVSVSIFVYGQHTEEVFYENGIKIHLIKSKKFALFSWYFYRKHIQNYLNHYILSDQIRVIEAPDWTGITAFMRLKAPLVIRFHGSDAYFCRLEGRKQKRKNFFFEKKALANAVAFIAPTDFAGKWTAEIFRLKEESITTIHNGLSLDQFENPNPEQFEKGLLLYIGTIIRKKGVFELPLILKNVMRDFPAANLVMIGSDSGDLMTKSVSTWQMIAGALPNDIRKNIQYLGKVPYEKVQEYLKKAHVCVFPTFAETLGMVTIESMAMQKPVVNSNMGWAREIIEDGVSGFLVDPKDHHAFAAKISALLNDDDLCRKTGTGARDRVSHKFDIEKIANENIAFYQKILL